MVLNRNPFPNVGDLVVAKVVTINDQYVTVELEDYIGNEPEKHKALGMVVISEVSNARIRNIRTVIMEDQKLVLLVLKVDPDKGQIDLSLRQVSKENQSAILSSWKQEQKAEQQMLFMNQEYLKMDKKDLYEKIIYPLIEEYSYLRSAFEKIKEFGLKAVENLQISEELKLKVVDFVSSHTQFSFIEIPVEFEIKVPESNGIEIIKTAFEDLDKFNIPNHIETVFSYVGAPRYRCVVKARDYATAEATLTKISEQMKEKIESTKKGTVTMIRVE
jgi:translation initiation factor 2 subunit 1